MGKYKHVSKIVEVKPRKLRDSWILDEKKQIRRKQEEESAYEEEFRANEKTNRLNKDE